MFKSGMQRKIERQIIAIENLVDAIENNIDRFNSPKGIAFLIETSSRANRATRLMWHFYYKNERKKRLLGGGIYE